MQDALLNLWFCTNAGLRWDSVSGQRHQESSVRAVNKCSDVRRSWLTHCWTLALKDMQSARSFSHTCVHTHIPLLSSQKVSQNNLPQLHIIIQGNRHWSPFWWLQALLLKRQTYFHTAWTVISKGPGLQTSKRNRKLQHCTTSTSQTQNQTAWFSEAGLLHFPRALEIFWHNPWSAHCGQSQPWTVTIWERSTCTSWMSLISHLEPWPRVLKAELVLTGKVF